MREGRVCLSVRQASGALNELARLLPDTAELLAPDGTTTSVAARSLEAGDLVLVRRAVLVQPRGRGARTASR